MTCPACADPTSGLRILGCRGCDVREIAGGLLYWSFVRSGGTIRDEYGAALERLGPDVQTAHAEVQAAAKRIRKGAIAA